MDDLSSLKNQILDDLIGLIDEDGVEPAEKFDILMTRYDSSGDTGLLQKAYDAAKGIEDGSVRGNALMQLLEEINISQSATAQPQLESSEPQKAPSANQETQEIEVQQD